MFGKSTTIKTFEKQPKIKKMGLWLVWVTLLLWIAWQDFRYRAVYAFLFPLVIAVVIVHTLRLDVFSLKAVGVNLLILLLQVIALGAVIRVRTRGGLMDGERWIAWGDLSFFTVLAFCFSTTNFVLFHVFSLISTLLVALLAKGLGFKVEKIPLAGAQAAILCIFVIFDFRQLGMGLFLDMDIFKWFS
ncbi:hypothetical protein [Parapedobacter sp. 10938]|uniref:hypothetical protein n=1 Tax=Parapedobacter flavus TaxID=3110225 RepID=UPI002DB791AE|nr:hypothetical protein [Parapedobacter sp. 10938]MEC3882007.1 hypothetical protein [Parapedobacter sp. 10938]